jgi:bifunctional non-homologous end joining protein LigD
VNGKYVPGTDADAREMLEKGDLKFRLNGKRLNGDFALVRIRSRRPGSRGTEWLLIKKHDEHEVPGFDIEQYDTSVLTGRTMAQIGGDQESNQWKSSRPSSRGRLKAPWLAEALAKAEKKKLSAEVAKKKPARAAAARLKKKLKLQEEDEKSSSAVSAHSAVSSLKGAVAKPMPSIVRPMLAVPIEEPFDSDEWLFEIKWDGYRAVSFIEDGKLRLVSRNQNDLTAQYSELGDLPKFVRAKNAIVDGEVVAVDEQGRPSFSLMQQRSGVRHGRFRAPARSDVPVLYYAFDLIYLDGYDLHKVDLEDRKRLLGDVIIADGSLRFSDHQVEKGTALYRVAAQQGLEGIVAKRRKSCYEEKRTREWLKIKITKTIEAVIGGYTEPEGTRDYFGSTVLGLYDGQGRLIHVGQAGTGFDRKTLEAVWNLLKKLDTKTNPFHGPVEALKKVHWVKPELVAEIKFSEWTHETREGGLKLRAPVFLGLREDKSPKECTFEEEVVSG